MGYDSSPFRSYLRNVVGLDEDGILLTLEQHNSFFITNEELPTPYKQLMIFQRLFTPGVIIKGLYELNMMTLA